MSLFVSVCFGSNFMFAFASCLFSGIRLSVCFCLFLFVSMMFHVV